MEPVIEEAFSYIGITDETILTGDVNSQRIIQDDDMAKNSKISYLIPFLSGEDPTPKYLMNIMTSGFFQFKDVYNYGKKEYVDGLPTLQISANATVLNFDNEDAQTLVDSIESTVATVVENSYRKPTVEEYIQSYLYGKYSYNPNTNKLIYDNKEYSYLDSLPKSVSIEDSGEYYNITTYYYIDVVIGILNPIRHKVTETIDITIESSIYKKTTKTIEETITYTDGTTNTTVTTSYIDPSSATDGVTTTNTTDADGNTIETITTISTIYYDKEVKTTTLLEEYYNDSNVIASSYSFISNISNRLIEKGTGIAETTTTVIKDEILNTDIPYFIVFKEHKELTKDTNIKDDYYDIQNYNYNTEITVMYSNTSSNITTYTSNDWDVVSKGSGIVTTPQVITDFTSNKTILQSNTQILNGIETSTYTTNVLIHDGSRKKMHVISYYTTDPNILYYICYYQRFNETGWLSSSTNLISKFKNYSSLTPMPVIPIKYESVWWENFSNTKLKDDVKEMLKYINISPEDIINPLKDNPNSGNVTEAFIDFSFSPKESEHNKYIAEYLFIFLEAMYSNTIAINDSNFSTGISITMKEGKFNSLITYEYVNKIIKTGNTFTGNTYDFFIHSNGNDLVVQKQINDTEIAEHVMKNLSYFGIIRRSNETFGVNKTINDTSLSIPLVYEHLTKMAITDQMELLVHSIRLTTYSSELQHLEWYETSDFMNLVQVVAFAVAIATFIPTGGQSSWLIVAAEAAATLAITYGIKLALEYVYTQTDNEIIRTAATIAAVTATIYAGYLSGSIDTDNTSQLVFSSAVASANMISLSMNMDIALKMEDLEDRKKRFMEIYENRLNRIEEVKSVYSSINTNTVLNMVENQNWKPYTLGIDSYYDIAKGRLATNYDLMYNIGQDTDYFYAEKLKLGIL